MRVRLCVCVKEGVRKEGGRERSERKRECECERGGARENV